MHAAYTAPSLQRIGSDRGTDTANESAMLERSIELPDDMQDAKRVCFFSFTMDCSIYSPLPNTSSGNTLALENDAAFRMRAAHLQLSMY